MGLWSHCVSELQLQFSEEDIITWVRPINALEKESELILVCPNKSFARWVEKNCRAIIQKKADEYCGKPVKLSLIDFANLSLAGELNLSEEQGFKQSESVHNFTSFVNPYQTFETFVVGESNRAAKHVAEEIARDPKSKYNPLFLHSGVGLGKTHLLNAIGNERIKQHPHHKVLYLTCERFVSDVFRSISESKTGKFRSYFRSVDLLLLDDVHFLSNKKRSCEDFLHIFNELTQNHKQIVLSSNRYPEDIRDVGEHLISRFISGLPLRIDAPDEDTRVAIVINKAAEQGVNIDREVAQFIAEKFVSNVRTIEGAVRRVVVAAKVAGAGKTPNIELANKALEDALVARSRTLSAETIQKGTADFYEIKLEELLSKSRKRGVVFPRQMAMALCKELTTLSLPAIGDAFGRDHTTVLHAARKIKELCEKDPKVRGEYKNLKAELRNR